MKAFPLYLRYAMRSFVRGRSRSLFGAFCVAVGVASVVALGLVSANYRDSITGDARTLNRGDISVSPPGLGFTTRQYASLATLKREGKIVDYTRRLEEDTALRTPNAHGPSTVGTIIGVDPRVFPFYSTIRADSPAGVPLRTLLRQPGDTVVSHDTLDTLHLKVGDRITINSRRGFNHTYRITGVVPDGANNPFFGAGFWNDFAMVNDSTIAPFFRTLDVAATSVYIKTAPASQAAQLRPVLAAHLGSLATIKTVADVASDERNSAAGFDKFFHVMGLVALVIGGIGIINTMLVAARRRIAEIAVLKSLGMKGRQVIAVFTIESLMLAVAGTGLGLLGGIGASAVVNVVTENLAGNPVPWSLHLEPLLSGALVGILATVLFSYLPIVAASRARPVAALHGQFESAHVGWIRRTASNLRRRPVATVIDGLRRLPANVVTLPRRPGFRTFLLCFAIAATVGCIAVEYAGIASRVRALVVGAIAGTGTLVAATLLTQIFVVIVWLVSKLPAAGRLSFRMAFRSMNTQKRRLASTMLALCVGMLAVGSVAILAQNLRTFASQSSASQLGINVVMQVPPNAAAVKQARSAVSHLPGVLHYDVGAISNSALLVSVDGHSVSSLLQAQRKNGQVDSNTLTQIESDARGLEGRDITRNHYNWTFSSGRELDARDAGTNHIVVFDDLKHIGVRVGSQIVFRDGTRVLPFTVVGMVDSQSSQSVMANNEVDLGYLRKVGLTSRGGSHFSLVYLNIRQSNLKADVATLRSSLHQDLVLDLGSFATLIIKAIDKLALFPEIIGALALFAGVIIIANTVALAMLERRRDIGVMKAVGARRGTIVRFLLVENAIIGFLGAATGVGLSMVATALVDQNLLKIGASFDWLTVAGLIALGVLLAMGASALTALPASGEKPMRVLRAE